jgi:hypothetical protein
MFPVAVIVWLCAAKAFPVKVGVLTVPVSVFAVPVNVGVLTFPVSPTLRR